MSAPVLRSELDAKAAVLRRTLDIDPGELSSESRREREDALTAVNDLSGEVLELSFKALAGGREPPSYNASCPFRGLYAFRFDDRAYFFGKARENRDGTAIAVAHNITDREVRLVAIDHAGKEHLPTSSTRGGARHMVMLDVEFDLPPGQIREYQLQSRPVGRFEIKHVALVPRKGG